MGRCPKGRGDRSVRGGRRSRSEGSYCKIEVLEPLRHFVTPPLSGEAYLFKRFVGTRRAVSDVFVAKKKSLKTFHRNVSKIKKQQPAHRAERSCSLRPRKASLFSPTCSVCPEAWARGVSPSADGDSGGYSPPKNLSPAALSWISLTDSTIPFLFVPARCFSQFALVFLRILCTSNCFTSAFCFSICTFLQTTT